MNEFSISSALQKSTENNVWSEVSNYLSSHKSVTMVIISLTDS